MLGPFKFNLYETRVGRKSLSLASITPKLSTDSSRLRLGQRLFSRYVLSPAPAKTPHEPELVAESYPALSMASQAHSRKRRCCTSIISASRGVKPKKEASKRSISDKMAPALT